MTFPVVAALLRLGSPGVALVLDHQGFEDRTHSWGVGRVPWSEVGDLEHDQRRSGPGSRVSDH